MWNDTRNAGYLIVMEWLVMQEKTIRCFVSQCFLHQMHPKSCRSVVFHYCKSWLKLLFYGELLFMLVEPVSSWIWSTVVPCLHCVCIAMCTSCIYNECHHLGPWICVISWFLHQRNARSSLLEAYYFDYACLEWHHYDAKHVPCGIRLEHGGAACDMLITQHRGSGTK